MLFHLLVWMVLALTTFALTKIATGVLKPLPQILPEPRLETNYTDGNYNRFWAQVYQSNPTLKSVTYDQFMRNPQQHLHEKVLTLPIVDTEAFEPLLLEQQIIELESYLIHVDQEELARAKRVLSGDEFQSLIATLSVDGKTHYQF